MLSEYNQGTTNNENYWVGKNWKGTEPDVTTDVHSAYIWPWLGNKLSQHFILWSLCLSTRKYHNGHKSDPGPAMSLAAPSSLSSTAPKTNVRLPYCADSEITSRIGSVKLGIPVLLVHARPCVWTVWPLQSGRWLQSRSEHFPWLN